MTAYPHDSVKRLLIYVDIGCRKVESLGKTVNAASSYGW